ncbi:MAG: DNA-binding protein YbiB [Betaproteobacteria bacterium]|nr:MAG: DNA-binding protein YbiB [Betaproteobacteria bacterium]
MLTLTALFYRALSEKDNTNLQFHSVIKEIGRGARGARGLSPELAYESFAALLRGEVSDVQVGAWWLAMRIKGESPDELSSFERAMHDSLAFRLVSDRPVIVLPCYNGARQLPNLTPLLAWLLAQRGTRVLLHGVRSDPSRVSTFELFGALGLPTAETLETAQAALTESGLAFVPIDALHPQLARLLANRWRIGVRSTGHTVAKLLQPMQGDALRVVALTHGDYIDRLGAHLQSSNARAAVFRGCEGEPVLHPKRAVPLHIFENGNSHMHEWHGVPTHDLPDTCDVATTVAYIQQVISGVRAMPLWIDWLARELLNATYENGIKKT